MNNASSFQFDFGRTNEAVKLCARSIINWKLFTHVNLGIDKVVP